MEIAKQVQLRSREPGELFWKQKELGKVVEFVGQEPPASGNVLVIFFERAQVQWVSGETLVLPADDCLQLRYDQFIEFERSPDDIPYWDRRYIHSTTSAQSKEDVA